MEDVQQLDSPRVGLFQQHETIIEVLGSFHLSLCCLRPFCFRAGFRLGHKVGPLVLGVTSGHLSW